MPQNNINTAEVLRDAVFMCCLTSIDTATEEDITAIENETDVEKIIPHLKEVVEKSELTSENSTTLKAMLAGCLSSDFVFLRDYNRAVSKSYKTQVEDAIRSADIDELLDAILGIHTGLVAAFTIS